MLSSFTLPANFDLMGDFLLQQDNCSVHIARSTNEEKGFELLDWLARSPVLNIIKKVWAMLSEIVYDGSNPVV